MEPTPEERILEHLRRHSGRLCPDAVLYAIGWGPVKPLLGTYRTLLARLADAVAESGRARLERVPETGWILLDAGLFSS